MAKRGNPYHLPAGSPNHTGGEFTSGPVGAVKSAISDHVKQARHKETKAAEKAAKTNFDKYWAGSATASVKRDIAAGRVQTLTASRTHRLSYKTTAKRHAGIAKIFGQETADNIAAFKAKYGGPSGIKRR